MISMKYEYYECGQGWTTLIKEAKSLVKKYNDEHPELEHKIEFTQIKEKFGYLNLYLNIYPRELHKQLLDISKRSTCICENCGKPAKSFNHHGWIYTLCENCRKTLNR